MTFEERREAEIKRLQAERAALPCEEMELTRIGSAEEISIRNGFDPESLAVFEMGYEGNLYFLYASDIPERVKTSFGSTVSPEADSEYAALIIEFDWEKQAIRSERKVLLGRHLYQFHTLLPLGEGFFLCGYRNFFIENEKEQWNAFILDRSGKLKSSLYLGDGINHLMTTADRRIIAGYSDEGVFGLYSDEDEEPLGKQGLVIWDDKGNKVWENQKHEIDDMYDLEVDDQGEIWFYPYMPFDLVHLNRSMEDTAVSLDIEGSHRFIIAQNRDKVLFGGGYFDENSHYYVYDLGQDTLTGKRNMLLKCEGREVTANTSRVNGSKVIFIGEDAMLYAARFV